MADSNSAVPLHIAGVLDVVRPFVMAWACYFCGDLCRKLPAQYVCVYFQGVWGTCSSMGREYKRTSPDGQTCRGHRLLQHNVRARARARARALRICPVAGRTQSPGSSRSCVMLSPSTLQTACFSSDRELLRGSCPLNILRSVRSFYCLCIWGVSA